MTGVQPDSDKPSNRNTETARHTLSERNNMQKPDDISEPHAEAIELNFQSVTDLADMQTVSQLAGEIWREHYMSIIGATQIEYMLARFRTAEAIAGQINAGYRYYLAIHQQRDWPILRHCRTWKMNHYTLASFMFANAGNALDWAGGSLLTWKAIVSGMIFIHSG